MVHKTPAEHPGYVCVIFELPSCVWADRISVTGSFNDWDNSALPMRQDRDGVWRAVIDLPAGHRYEFRYIVDGRWQTDYHADGLTDNSFGADNSVVDLEWVLPVPMNERLSSKVPEGHATLAPHLPAPYDAPAPPARSGRSQPEISRLRPRVAAA